MQMMRCLKTPAVRMLIRSTFRLENKVSFILELSCGRYELYNAIDITKSSLVCCTRTTSSPRYKTKEDAASDEIAESTQWMEVQ